MPAKRRSLRSVSDIFQNHSSSTADLMQDDEDNWTPDRNPWFKWRGSVIPKTLSYTIAFTLWGVLWSCLFLVPSKLNPADANGKPSWVGFNSSLVPILSVVVGLLLVFRTNSAYDRFYEGRRLWSSLIHTIRNLARQIWLQCPEINETDRRQKRAALKLLIAFAYASKHHIRNEHGVQDDMRAFTPNLPAFKHSLSRTEFIKHLRQRRPVSTGSFSPQQTSVPSSPLPQPRVSMGVRPSFDSAAGRDKNQRLHRYGYKCGCIRLPMEIANLLVIYLKERRNKGQISEVLMGQLFLMVNAMMENVAGFERIFTTPIPVAYSLHLKHTVVLYLLSLPFQLVKDLNWWVIPIMTITSFTLMGVENIGAEIENPFGNDAN
ncbi:hypothetical protein HK102_000982, partial [Quaeritorhiza haematococci]